MRIVITGAAGRIGRLAVEELAADHHLTLIDRRPVQGRRSIVADLSRDPDPFWRAGRWGWGRALEGADAVLHLAAVSYSDGRGPLGWRRIRRANIEGTWNVLRAAARHRVPKLVFASSIWAVQADVHDRSENGGRIDSRTPPRPLLSYGLSKAFGETAGRMFVDEKRIRAVIAVRIGYCPPDGRPQNNDWLRQRWIGPRDMVSLLRRCAEAPVEGFHVVYGVSRIPNAPFDLAHARDLLGWEPVETLPSEAFS